MKIIKPFLIIILFPALMILAQGKKQIALDPGPAGTIPVWLVAGPYEYPLEGFGVSKDTAVIGEPDVSPAEGDMTASVLDENEKHGWEVQSPDDKGFIDFNKVLRWNVNTATPIKIWYSRGAYAFTKIISGRDRELLLLSGSNSMMKVFLNGEKVFSYNNARNSQKDQDTVRIKLRKGENRLLLGVLNTHANQGLAFFGTEKWEWGFYTRLVESDGTPARDLKYLIDIQNKSDFNVVSTIFFRQKDKKLVQRLDVEINSSITGLSTGRLNIKGNGEFQIDSVRFGKTRYSFYIPEIEKTHKVNAELVLGTDVIKKEIQLEARKKYKLHVMLLNHTDVGYTHPQPVIEELHCNTLDDVIKMCSEHADFHWTIETVWQLEAYEKLRSPEKFKDLIGLIKEGRVALSPIYSNPFTGWISEEEMLRSLDKGLDYRKRFGISFLGAVYNDVPGQSWFLPQVLSKTGVKFIAEGINEFYSDYKLQRNLPKVFNWEAADGSRIVTFLNEAYNEGKTYGLESNDVNAVEQLVWERISKLEARDYKPDIVLINTSFNDNGILAAHQYEMGQKWNEQYEYPKFISSNVNLFTEELLKSDAYKELPVLRGDFTSNWDIFYQGEFERNKKERWSQYQLLSAEKLSTLSNLLDSSKLPMNKELSDAYRSMLQFDGHGSGLEYGYGSPEENKLTMDYRQNYVDNAALGTESVLLKSVHRITKPEESLESEGVMIFNTLSWQRSGLVEIQYPFDSSPQYEIIDPVTKEIVPSFRKDHRQYFIASNVPSLGFKKYQMRQTTNAAARTSGLIKADNSIENQYYKIIYDPAAGYVSSIIDKKTNTEVINQKSGFRFSYPSAEKFQLKQNYASIPGLNPVLKIIDESPVRIIMRIEFENQITDAVEFSLLDGMDKIFINADVNLEALEKTATITEYGLPFEFNIPKAEVKSGILGGFIDLHKDRLPGIDHDGVSLRSSVSIFNKDKNIIWSTADARVIRIRKDSTTGEPVVISNTINNFPDSWNRHENLSGKINFRYSINSGNGSFSPSQTAMDGFELNTPFQIRKSWYRPEPSSEEYFTVDNPSIMLLNLKAADDGFIIRILNTDDLKEQTAVIKSRFIKDRSAQEINLLGAVIKPVKTKSGQINVSLKPGEFSDILIK